MKKTNNQRGEIATALTLISLGLMVVGALVGSFASQKQTRLLKVPAAPLGQPAVTPKIPKIIADQTCAEFCGGGPNSVCLPYEYKTNCSKNPCGGAAGSASCVQREVISSAETSDCSSPNTCYCYTCSIANCPYGCNDDPPSEGLCCSNPTAGAGVPTATPTPGESCSSLGTCQNGAGRWQCLGENYEEGVFCVEDPDPRCIIIYDTNDTAICLAGDKCDCWNTWHCSDTSKPGECTCCPTQCQQEGGTCMPSAECTASGGCADTQKKGCSTNNVCCETCLPTATPTTQPTATPTMLPVATPTTALCTTSANCYDGNVCTADTCVNGTCVYPNLPNGTSCHISASMGTCNNGICVVPTTPPRTCIPNQQSCMDTSRQCCSGLCVNGYCQPDTTSPLVSIETPSDGTSVSGTQVEIRALVSDNVGVGNVEFYRGSTMIYKYEQNPPQLTTEAVLYIAYWDSTSVPDGSYNLSVQAYDGAGNIGGDQVTPVYVVNAAAPTATPTSCMFNSQDACIAQCSGSCSGSGSCWTCTPAPTPTPTPGCPQICVDDGCGALDACYAYCSFCRTATPTPATQCQQEGGLCLPSAECTATGGCADAQNKGCATSAVCCKTCPTATPTTGCPQICVDDGCGALDACLAYCSFCRFTATPTAPPAVPTATPTPACEFTSYQTCWDGCGQYGEGECQGSGSCWNCTPAPTVTPTTPACSTECMDYGGIASCNSQCSTDNPGWTCSGRCCCPPVGAGPVVASADVNGDGVVNLNDYSLALTHYRGTIYRPGGKLVVNALVLSNLIISLSR